MRPSLLHPRAEQRPSRRRRRHGQQAGRGATVGGEAAQTRRDGAAAQADPSDVSAHVTDDAAAVERVREAGGPVDRAAYACQCGYLFVASVSTTVLCPHCGVTQAW